MRVPIPHLLLFYSEYFSFRKKIIDKMGLSPTLYSCNSLGLALKNTHSILVVQLHYDHLRYPSFNDMTRRLAINSAIYDKKLPQMFSFSILSIYKKSFCLFE
mmetsp:Transcript_25276/g.22398  ORF Transcript_25276/g.22398 Transcript_25276/m.22398 type:complete len:102 (-) Transcript_25276:205-510(-)